MRWLRVLKRASAPPDPTDEHRRDAGMRRSAKTTKSRKRRKSGAIRGLLTALAVALASPSVALDITDGDVVVQNLGSFGFTANNSVLSFDGGATDQLYQMFGYLGTASGVERVNGTSFSVLTPLAAVGPTATSVLELNATGAAALGLNAGDVRIEYTFELVNDTSALDIDGFTWDFTITNQSTGSLDLTFYSYLDLDLDGAADFGDDIATADLQRILVTDADSTTRYYWNASNSGTADHFAVQQYPTVRNFLDGLSTVTDLSDSAASFGPADFTAAYQYDFTIAAGASAGNGVGSISPVPEPATAVLLGLGLAGLAHGGRARPERRL